MSQPARWLWGLIPLALLWGAGNVGLDAAIERNVGERAVRAVSAAAGEAPGMRPVVAQVDGRDVTISGEVLSTDGATRAMAQLRAEFGVRRALGGLSQVVAQKPYSWSANRMLDRVVLGGFVPDLDTAAANLAAASLALPGLRIDDRQTIAFGAPEGFAAMAVAMIAELPKLASGRIMLDDGRFCIEGKAATPEAFRGLEAAAALLARPGFQPVNCDLEPPVVAPYRWSAERDTGNALVLRGFYPSDESHKQMLQLVQRVFGATTSVRDELQPGLGAPPAFLEKIGRAIADLARLREGRAELDAETYSLSGKGPDSYDACQALRLQIAQQDGPDSVARATIDCPPEPPPVPVIVPLPEVPGLILDDVRPAAPATAGAASAPAMPSAGGSAANSPTQPVPAPAMLDWTARRDAARIALAGAVPSEVIRANLLAAARSLFAGTAIEDRLAVDPRLHSELDVPSSLSFALEVLSRLKSGSVAIRDKSFTVAGEVADATGLAALRQILARGGPAGLAVTSLPDDVLVRPYGLALSMDRSGLRLSGYLPDEAARATLLALVADSPLKDRFEDAAIVVPGAPSGFATTARIVLTDLLRLDLGSASIEDERVSLRGLTCRELIRSEVETSTASGLPPGFKADAAIGLRQTGCVVDPPASCQNDLDGLTTRNTVLFGQGTSVVELDATTERVIGEAAAILKKCPDTSVTIEGHANRDGERRGFDNMDLSLRRAARVREELTRRGIDPGKLAVKAYGSTRPIAPYDTPQAKTMNRRVQFTVVK